MAIPTYNCRETISEAVESIFAQTFKDCEFTVFDDGSTDGTVEVLEKYRDRVILPRQENRGPAAGAGLGERREFVDMSARAVRENKSLEIIGQAGLRVMSVMDAVYRSAATGEKEIVKDVDSA